MVDTDSRGPPPRANGVPASAGTHISCHKRPKTRGSAPGPPESRSDRFAGTNFSAESWKSVQNVPEQGPRSRERREKGQNGRKRAEKVRTGRNGQNGQERPEQDRTDLQEPGKRQNGQKRAEKTRMGARTNFWRKSDDFCRKVGHFGRKSSFWPKVGTSTKWFKVGRVDVKTLGAHRVARVRIIQCAQKCRK